MRSCVGKCSVVVLLICSFIMAGAGAENTGPIQSLPSVAVAVAGGPVSLPVPTPVSDSDPSGNYTKLDILPQYLNFMIRPGEDDEKTVTIRNRDSRSVTVRPIVQITPYSGPYQIERSWISFTPQQAEIPAGESMKFTVRATVPKGTDGGTYNTQIALTDEQYPSPYPQAYPNYVHMMSLMVSVISTPVLETEPIAINDQLQGGKDYRYAVTLTNNGVSPLSIAPRVVSNSYPVMIGSSMQEPALTEKSFTIHAPASIPAGGNATMFVIVNAPAERTGSFYGYIDPGTDNPSVRPGEGQVQLNFQVWQQPQESFKRKFTMTSKDPITITLTATGQSQYPGTDRDPPASEPSFGISLAGPDGMAGVHRVSEDVRGTVTLAGSAYGIYGYTNPGEYQEMVPQYVFTYSADGAPGEWTLEVVPENMQTFSYEISLGKDASSSETYPFTMPF